MHEQKRFDAAKLFCKRKLACFSCCMKLEGARRVSMKSKYIFHHDNYYHTLKSQVGNGIPVFHGVRQRGGGIGSVLGGIAKYALPLIAKYVLPHAKSAVADTFSDLTKNGLSVKQALKSNGLQFLKNVGSGVVSSVLSKQSGNGLVRKSTKPANFAPRSSLLKTLLKKKTRIKKRGVSKKTRKRTRADIFS